MLPFKNQVGGHKELTEEGGALVVPAPGLVAKPTGHGYWAGEDSFYEALSKRADPLLQWCPAYHGTRVLAGRTHVVMEDLTHGMRRPCVVDIKVGTCTVAPDAAWPKRVSHLLKDRQTTTRSLGLRIIGVHQPPAAAGGEAVVRDKAHGKRLRPAQVGRVLPPLPSLAPTAPSPPPLGGMSTLHAHCQARARTPSTHSPHSPVQVGAALRECFSVDGELCVGPVRAPALVALAPAPAPTQP